MNAKVEIANGGTRLSIEGSEEFVQNQLAKESASRKLLDVAATEKTSEDIDDSIKAALDHAWNWFALHAGQRMHTVNFFLIAAAFLANAYVLALRDKHYPVAAGVAALAVIIAMVFYRLETRVRELLKAGEAALRPSQTLLAQYAGNSSITILDRVEVPSAGIWAYSRVFRWLYGTTGIAFVLGFVYGSALWYGDGGGGLDLGPWSRDLLIGLAMAGIGSYIVKLSSQFSPASTSQLLCGVVSWLVGMVSVAIGLCILTRLLQVPGLN